MFGFGGKKKEEEEKKEEPEQEGLKVPTGGKSSGGKSSGGTDTPKAGPAGGALGGARGGSPAGGARGGSPAGGARGGSPAGGAAGGARRGSPAAEADHAGPVLGATPAKVDTPAPKVLAVGGTAYVQRAGGKNLRLRSAAGLETTVLDGLTPGTQMTLLAGPVENDGYPWWHIRTSDGREGWVAGTELVIEPD